jgi:hypothetical protein
VIGALFSALRGKRYIYQATNVPELVEELAETSGGLPGEIAVSAEVVR